MDGATKFIKGDAIVGIIILLIDIVGGLFIGIISKGMALAEAVQKYTLLTVGDGLVSQIPALLVSTATGLVVTRAASETNLDQDMIEQLFKSNSKLLYIVGGSNGLTRHTYTYADLYFYNSSFTIWIFRIFIR